MKRIIYFAYGSNMSQRRLIKRLPSAQYLGIGVLDDYRLAFHKVSHKDGSGKCDIVTSAKSQVYGVLYSLSEVELAHLDRYEGSGYGYQRRIVTVRDGAGKQIEAWAYLATHIDPKLHPYTWYMRHLLEGAREARLPPDYVRVIEMVVAVDDPDQERAGRELAIYARQAHSGGVG